MTYSSAIIYATILLIGIIALTWLKKKTKIIEKTVQVYAIASGAQNLLKIEPEEVPAEKIEVREPEVIREVEAPQLERMIRILFGYGGLLKHALELDVFSVRELAQKARVEDSIAGAWLRERLTMGLLEEIEDRYTGEIRYRIRREVLNRISSDVLWELSKITRESG